MLSTTELPDNLSFSVGDMHGQRRFRISGLPRGSTVAEMIAGVIGPMGLPRNDSEGRPLTYKARLTREGRHLRAQEAIHEALREGDEISMHPNVDAG